jgi:hypothetical protein
MPVATNFENFQAEVCRLIEIFGKNLKDLKNPGYDELKLRMDFLDPFFKSLGWDVENRAGHITAHREVEVESRTKIEGGQRGTTDPDQSLRLECAVFKDFQSRWIRCGDWQPALLFAATPKHS